MRSVAHHRAQTSAAVTVGTSLTTILSIELRGEVSDLMLWLENLSATAFNDCALQIQPVAGAAWVTYNDTWTTAADNLRFFSGNLKTLANAEGSSWLRLPPCHAVRVQASVASGSTTANAAFVGLSGV